MCLHGRCDAIKQKKYKKLLNARMRKDGYIRVFRVVRLLSLASKQICSCFSHPVGYGYRPKTYYFESGINECARFALVKHVRFGSRRDGYYEAGFHSFVYKKDALNFLQYVQGTMPTYLFKLVTWYIKLEWITTCGFQDAVPESPRPHLPCVVTNQIFVPRERSQKCA